MEIPQMIEFDLYERAILDERTVKPYIGLRKKWSKELALEFVVLLKMIYNLQEENQRLSDELSQLAAQVNRPRRLEKWTS